MHPYYQLCIPHIQTPEGCSFNLVYNSCYFKRVSGPYKILGNFSSTNNYGNVATLTQIMTMYPVYFRAPLAVLVKRRRFHEIYTIMHASLSYKAITFLKMKKVIQWVFTFDGHSPKCYRINVKYQKYHNVASFLHNFHLRS